MLVKSAEFIISNTSLSGCPTDGRPEFAFIGRSNVGKSSLINLLTRNKKLAAVSGKPGKTRLINHFLINKNWYLVDLPGYGYAKVGKTERLQFEKMVQNYFLKREALWCVFQLIDSRHEPMKIDLEFTQFLGECGVPFVLVFTKADKSSMNVVNSNVAKYRRLLAKDWEEIPTHFITSAESGFGKDELLNFIGEALESEGDHKK